ncbi:MAG: TonB family protein [Cyclobacteriaceae bacterium]|nr:TonB family protein [Cyclobacteriaceae bacterium]
MEPKKNPNKDVHRYTKQFFLFGFAISVALVIVAFEWRSRVSQNDGCDLPDPRDITFYPYEVIQVKNETPSPDKPKKVKLVDPDRIIEADNTEKDTSDEPLAVEIPEAHATGSIEIDIPIEVSIDTFIVVEKMPVPVGGFDSFYRQLGKSVKYPSLAKRSGTEGKVFVEFVINEFGEPVNFKVVKGIGSGCDEEAIRVLKLVQWEPGKQRGKPVAVRKVLPVYFKLN